MLRRVALAAALCAAACNDSNCQTGIVDVSQICLPDSITPNLAIDMEVRELCGRGCSGMPTCTALWRNSEIQLYTEQDVCEDTLTSACVNQGCQERAFRCRLPALNPGEYVISAPGGISRVLRVEQGGSSSCRFAPDAGS
jgi:hypothetical protein